MFSGIAECEAQECVLSDHQEIAVFTAEQVPSQMMSDIRDMAEKEPLILYETDGNDAITAVFKTRTGQRIWCMTDQFSLVVVWSFCRFSFYRHKESLTVC